MEVIGGGMVSMGRIAVAVLVVAAFAHPVGAAGSGSAVVEKTFTSDSGVEFEASLDTEAQVIEIRAENPTEERKESGVVLSVDGTTVYQSELTLSPGETWSTEIEFRRSLDALETEHTAAVSTYGASAEFEFDHDVDPEAPDGVAVPYIADVNVTDGTIDGEPSAVARVTVVNPSVQTYPLKLMVHTEGTDGSFYAAITPPGESETITVELLDERGSEIRGEARLYAGEFDEREGGVDQVGFVGSAGEGTETWNESYDPVAAPWSDDPYEYRNGSAGGETNVAERASGGHAVGGVPAVYPIAGALALTAAVFVRRR